MKILQKVNSKILALVTTLVLAVVTLFAGVNVSVAPKASAAETNMTYIDTQVEDVRFLVSNKIIFAFRLTKCDYADFTEPVGDFPVGTPRYDYITSLSYWKNFSKYNTKGVEFNQLFAYWNGGWGDSQIGLSRGEKAVGHRSSLERLEYGFIISFPAGTTFPCLEYIVNGCQGTPVAYKTTENVAFLYNGTEFVKVDYRLADARMSASEEMNSVDLSKYLPAEQQQVLALVQETEASLASCTSLYDVDVVMNAFNAALVQIKTVEYYAQLNNQKAQAKQQVEAFFNGLTESAYGEAEWAALMQMKAESGALIDEAMDQEALEKIVAGIQYKAEGILTEEEKPASEARIAAAIQCVADAFDASLYREAEAAQGAAYVAEVETLLNGLDASTKSVAAVEAIELAYLAKIAALKTDAEWTAEEEANKKPEKPQVQPQPEQPTVDEEPQKEGCSSSVNGTMVAISLAIMFSLILIKKNNKKRMDF